MTAGQKFQLFVSLLTLVMQIMLLITWWRESKKKELPIVLPGRLGAVPPLESLKDQDEKRPTAEAGRKRKVKQ